LLSTTITITITITTTITMTARSASPPPDQPSSPRDLPTMTKKQESTTASEHELKTANHVYILDKAHSWIPAQVVERTADHKAIVSIPQYHTQQSIVCDGGRTARRLSRQTIDLTSYPNTALPLQNVDGEGRLQPIEDMVDLPFLHEVSSSENCVFTCTALSGFVWDCVSYSIFNTHIYI
jgi:hypothetical protein